MLKHKMVVRVYISGISGNKEVIICMFVFRVINGSKLVISYEKKSPLYRIHTIIYLFYSSVIER